MQFVTYTLSKVEGITSCVDRYFKNVRVENVEIVNALETALADEKDIEKVCDLKDLNNLIVNSVLLFFLGVRWKRPF
jgi:AAA+ superfamily predicted ATPase